ncbi:ATP-binding protein [Halococcoides cellulosivorans]|uniref:ATPase n=1 Tax=Halococcoides cellulosivorans TaxID=1679096 RepID=A0A2R4X3G0_9EURY|nr:ATP-binding protein [Halococcoides cellulosivorans]AWB28328.1 ATPase [Halococcoides cellulosivorans]
MDQFVNRLDELDRLETLYESDAAELAIIYGRRQIGKSELVRRSIADRDDAVYYQAVQGTATTQLRRFVEAAATTYPDITAVKEEWEPLLTYLTDRDAVTVIDEFPYLVESNEGLPSVIQHQWDTAVDESQAALVLTGSAIGMMHTHVLDGGAPLYGRVSQTPNGRLELTQLPFRSIQEFVPTYDPEERVFVYGVFGGTPRYLSPLDPSESFGANVTRLLCDPDGPLHDEPETVLQMELNEVNTYFSVLESIASGNRSRNEIAQGAGIESTNTSYYFDQLETLQIIEKHHPALTDPARSKRTRYRIRDPVFRFYFRYLYGREGQYDLYGENAYADLIEPELPDFVSETFESLCHQAVSALYADYQLTAPPHQWWYKGQEIDVVAPTDESTLIAGEAKFTTTPLGYGVLADLEDDVKHIDWTPPEGDDPTYEFALFSRSGFKCSVEEAADERDDLRLFDLSDIVAVLEREISH